MAITNSYGARREMPRTSKSTNLIYMTTHTEIARRTDHGTFEIPPAQYFRFKNIVLYFGIGVILFVSNIRVQTQKCRFKPLRYQLKVSS